MDTSPNSRRDKQVRSSPIPAVIVAIAIIEWSLFELLRCPYRPPFDMRTLLGAEKYVVRDTMVAVAVVGTLYVLYRVLTSSFSIRGYFLLTTLVAILAMMAVVVVRYPLWPVTPWDLLWQ
jgi:hypothetical protein